MVILFVIDNYYLQSNGTTISTKRYVDGLKNLGHEVRILSTGSNIPGLYQLKERFIPIVTWVSRKQDVVFSKPNIEVINKALEGVDVVHFATPWKTSRVVNKIARKKGIPRTASFHIPPESITYGIGLKRAKLINYFIYRKFRRFYNTISHTHAPSNLVAENLKRHYYRTSLSVISNGVTKSFYEIINSPRKDRIKILTIGRFAKEKNQMTILKAINNSKYKDDIEIVFAGQGPWYNRLFKYAKKCNINAKFHFFTQEELMAEIKESLFYIHASSIETEGIAALEAIVGGLVPIVSDSKEAATSRLALDDFNKFINEDYLDLANKIDFLIENPNILKSSQLKYKEYGKKFELDNVLSLFEEMLTDSIREKKASKLSKTVKGKIFTKTIVPSPVNKTFSAMTYYLLAIPLLYLYSKVILNLKFKNLKRFRQIKGGAIIVSNHVHTLDSVFNSIATFPKRPIITAQPENFDLKIAGFFVHLLGARPTPRNPLETQIFFNKLSNYARKGRYIHMFPEGELIEKDTNIREFKRGAFKLAIQSSCPIIPIKIEFDKSKTLIWNRNRITLKVGQPIYPDLTINKKESLTKLQEQTTLQMKEL